MASSASATVSHGHRTLFLGYEQVWGLELCVYMCLGLQSYLSDTPEGPMFSGCLIPPPVHTLPRRNPCLYAELSLNLLKSLHPLSLQCLRRGPRPINECFFKTEDKHPCLGCMSHNGTAQLWSPVSRGRLVHAVLHRDIQGLDTCLWQSPYSAVGEK